MDEPEEGLGKCVLCGRIMVDGPSVNRHHLVPRAFGGKESVWIHRICHSKIHSVFTERELVRYYHTPDRLLEHEEVQRFVKWVRKKDPQYYKRNRQTKKRRAS